MLISRVRIELFRSIEQLEGALGLALGDRSNLDEALARFKDAKEVHTGARCQPADALLGTIQ